MERVTQPARTHYNILLVSPHPSHPPTVSATHSLRTHICWVASTPFNPWLLTHVMFTVASTEEGTAMLKPDLHP